MKKWSNFSGHVCRSFLIIENCKSGIFQLMESPFGKIGLKKRLATSHSACQSVLRMIFCLSFLVLNNLVLKWVGQCSKERWIGYTGCLKKNRDYGILYILHYKGWLYNRNYGFKYLYDKIYSIGYYSGFYSSMSDKI